MEAFIQNTPRDRFASAFQLLPVNPPYDTARTLQVMRYLVRHSDGDEVVRRMATRIIEKCHGHDFMCEIKALFEFVRDETIYRRDPVQVERIQDARRTIEFRTGDCDDKVILLASLLGAIGHPSRFVVIGPAVNHYSHVYLEVATDRGWLPLDPTNENAAMGWEAKGIRQSFPIWE